MKKILRLLGASLWLAASAQAAELTILELKHTLPEQALPILKPLLAPGGTLVGANHQLFVRTTSANLAEIKQALDALDKPRRQLLISVRQGQNQQQSGQRAGIDRASVRLGSGNTQWRIGGGLSSSSGSDSQQVNQQIRTLEGSPALIYIGQSLPLPMRYIHHRPGQTTISEGVEYIDVGSGFNASARLIGNEVTLTITPTQQRISNGNIEQSSLSTNISGPLNEWIALGGSTVSDNSSDRQLLGAGRHERQQQQQVWLKVEALDR